jgi:hypothetical protein
MTVREYSIRFEDDLNKGADKFKEIYRENLTRGGFTYENKILSIGEINNTAIILYEGSSVPNLMMIGLEELTKSVEEDIISKGFKLHKFTGDKSFSTDEWVKTA